LIVTLSLVVVLALAGAVALVTVDSDEERGAPERPARAGAPAPRPGFRVGVESVDFNRFTLHWLEDFATLAPAGLAVAQQGLSGPAPPASTKESDALNAALAADRGGVYSGSFSVPATASAKTVTPVISAATASYSAYHSATTAHAAYEAAKKFSTGGRTATANTPIALVPNAATNAFGFRSGPAKEGTFTAVLEFPGVLVQLTTTSANADQLTGLIAVVTSWARQ
jgi:hypothetical protein